MVAVHSFDLPAADPRQAWITEELGKLTEDERAQYDRDLTFRSAVNGALEWEWRNPGPTPTEREAAEAYGGDTVRCLVEQLVAHALEARPAGDAARLSALRRDRYGADFARELAELQGGAHPVQQPG